MTQILKCTLTPAYDRMPDTAETTAFLYSTADLALGDRGDK